MPSPTFVAKERDRTSDRVLCRNPKKMAIIFHITLWMGVVQLSEKAMWTICDDKRFISV
jgi:hypothetical protein